jgi:ABC-2 type transport system ATP-binding protein
MAKWSRVSSVGLSVAAAGLATAVMAASAAAAECPNASTTTVAGSPSYTYTRGCIKSFDGTAIVYNLFEPLEPAPHSVYPILEGPGWGGAGATRPDSRLIAGGYAELTWDPRGFGQSGGLVEIDSPFFEGRDVSSLISDVLSGRPEIVTDTGGAEGQPKYRNDRARANTVGQPVVGMAGGSYGGGIQLSAASVDNRIKAIVPALSWNDLRYAIFPGGDFKLGWGNLLFGVGLAEFAATHSTGDVEGVPALGGTGGVQIGGYDPKIAESEALTAALGFPPPEVLEWFGERSMAVFDAGGTQARVPNIPALFINGTVDTLFNLNAAWASYQQIRAVHSGAPLKMIAFCGGHVACPTGEPPSGENYSDTAPSASPIAAGESASTFNEDATIAWFNHYLRGQGETDGMPAKVVYQDQTGAFHGLRNFPTPQSPGQATYVSAPVSGTLVGQPGPTGVGPTGVDAVVTDGATSASDPSQVTVPVLTAPAKADVPVVGEGHVNATVTVTGTATNLFFRLLDKSTGDVVDLQTEPLRIDNLSATEQPNAEVPTTPQQISLNLAGTAYLLRAGDTLELQVSTTTDSFGSNRGASSIAIANGTVEVPTLKQVRTR